MLGGVQPAINANSDAQPSAVMRSVFMVRCLSMPSISDVGQSTEPLLHEDFTGEPNLSRLFHAPDILSWPQSAQRTAQEDPHAAIRVSV
jgi:hypothetical protein